MTYKKNKKNNNTKINYPNKLVCSKIAITVTTKGDDNVRDNDNLEDVQLKGYLSPSKV